MPPQATVVQPPLTLTALFAVLASCLALAAVALPAPSTQTLHPPPDEEAAGPAYWTAAGRQDIKEASAVAAEARQTAKNVVLFIGDGMGISTVTAARILKGQLENRSGEESYLAFERFAHLGLAKTYNTNQQTPDSAGTATAFLTGVKTLSGLIGVSDTAQRGNCSSMAEAQKLTSFLKLAADAGRAAGIVTTTRLTHATPAAAYSHSVERNWEDDSDRNVGVKDVDLRSRCPDIAQQFVDNAANFRVALGGGRQRFQPRRGSSRYTDPTTGQVYKGGRKDGVDLISKWKNAQSRAGRRYVYVETASQLEAVTAREADSVLGLMAPSHLEFHEDNQREASEAKRQPSLARMTTKAVELLSVYGQSSGFVLLVESGRIDHGHHGNQANRALYETVSLSEAVEATVNLLMQLDILNDTLMMVTADHSHVFTLGHYGARGQPITQLKYAKRDQYSQQLVPERAADGLPLTVVNYADGPGASKSRRERWESLTDDEEPEEDTTASEYRFPAMIQRSGESHGGEDVPIYAQGPGAHLIHRVHEQSYVAHVIMKAARLGPYAVDGAEEEP